MNLIIVLLQAVLMLLTNPVTANSPQTQLLASQAIALATNVLQEEIVPPSPIVPPVVPEIPIGIGGGTGTGPVLPDVSTPIATTTPTTPTTPTITTTPTVSPTATWCSLYRDIRILSPQQIKDWNSMGLTLPPKNKTTHLEWTLDGLPSDTVGSLYTVTSSTSPIGTYTGNKLAPSNASLGANSEDLPAAYEGQLRADFSGTVCYANPWTS